MKPEVLVAVALLSVAFGGCLAGEGVGLTANSAEEPASTVVVEPEKGVFVSDNRGVLRGVVYNDAGLPVTKAYVLLVGTDLSQPTSREGRFQFDNLTVGKKTIRVEAEGFRASENETHVAAGNITDVEIFLVPLETTGAGYREHLHDFWGDNTEVTILDEPVDLRRNTGQLGGAGGTGTQQAVSGVSYSAQNASGDQNKFRLRLPSDRDPPALIYPGTKEIKITISWSSPAFTGYKLGVGFRVPPMQSPAFLARQVSGSTWTISVAPEQWDSGHQWYSFWTLYVYTYQDPQADGANFRPGIITGNIQVKIVVVKGQLLPEPAHPKFWENGNTVEVATHERVIDCNSAYKVLERDYCRLLPTKIIPPGTGKLRVEMKWNYGTYEGTPATDLTVVYRMPHMNPGTTPVTQYKVASCTGTGQVRTCEIPVRPADTDAFYQRSSAWDFTYAVKGHESEGNDHEPRGFKLSMHIVAEKDATYVEA